MTWTQFCDMHSGGGTKVEPYEQIYIEAPEQEARCVFYTRLHHNPSRVTCTGCGEDYTIHEYKTLEDATEVQRQGNSLEEYKKKETVLIINADEIKPSERHVDIPREDPIWSE